MNTDYEMEGTCPTCKTELIRKSLVPTCPRKEIGECTFDIDQLPLDQLKEGEQHEL